MTTKPNPLAVSDVLVAGKPLFRTATHLIVDIESGRFVSQHRSEKAAEGGLRLRRGGLSFASLKILPVAAALAAFSEGT